MSRFDVVGIGENSVDVVCRVSGTVAPNTKLPIIDRKVLHGGQVATTLATCASLGLRTAYIGCFGSDASGSDLRDALDKRGIDTSHSATREARNRSATILVDERTGDRTVLWERDETLVLRADEIPREVIAGARALHVDSVDHDAALGAAHIARSAGIPITTDIDAISARTEALLSSVTVPILAESMPPALTGEADLERALRALRQPHHAMLCVTLGGRGAMMLVGDRLYYSPAVNVKVVDSTGAGDVFRGAFIVAMLRGDAPGDILRFANAAAAIACTREGALDSVPSLSEVRGIVVE
jgi:sugar/nucleoside kinase (ribokinase family)